MHFGTYFGAQFGEHFGTYFEEIISVRTGCASGQTLHFGLAVPAKIVRQPLQLGLGIVSGGTSVDLEALAARASETATGGSGASKAASRPRQATSATTASRGSEIASQRPAQSAGQAGTARASTSRVLKQPDRAASVSDTGAAKTDIEDRCDG